MLSEEDDNDSVEGAIARSLFRTHSDSSSGNDDQEEHDENKSLQEPLASPVHDENVIVQRKIGSVMIEERVIGGSIAHRLWPAAEYLADFITDRLSNLEATCSNIDETDWRDTDKIKQSALDKMQVLEKLDMILRGDSLDRGSREPPVRPPVSIIELGAGVGYTGLQLAATLPSSTVVLTDLEVGLALLNRNIELNRHSFRGGPDSVVAQRLDWTVEEDCDEAIELQKKLTKKQENDYHERPLLVIGSDCVYWEELHAPLENTLFALLSRAPVGSLCLLAGMRRWKRDNSFFKTIGKLSRKGNHELHCICLKETVSRADGQRVIMRIYAIEVQDKGSYST